LLNKSNIACTDICQTKVIAFFTNSKQKAIFPCFGLMKLYKVLDLRKAELERIYTSLGGQYSLWERLRQGGIGSPMIYYTKGLVAVDSLQALASDELRINMELLKEGVLFRIAERTNAYFIPIHQSTIKDLRLRRDTEHTLLTIETTTFSCELWGAIDSYMGWRKFLERIK